MLDFHYPQLNDKIWARELLSVSQFKGCEYTFGNMFIWSPIYNSKITRCNDFLISKGGGHAPAYCCPAGNGDLKAVFTELLLDAQQSRQHIPQLNQTF